MSETAFTQQMNIMRRMFSLGGISAPLLENACAFWETQDKLLNQMQDFANGWFERRHVGSQQALEATERMYHAETPLDWFREYQNWATGACGRVFADGMACQQLILASLGSSAKRSEDESQAEPTEPHFKSDRQKAA
jgi:hypothetical protein